MIARRLAILNRSNSFDPFANAASFDGSTSFQAVGGASGVEIYGFSVWARTNAEVNSSSPQRAIWSIAPSGQFALGGNTTSTGSAEYAAIFGTSAHVAESDTVSAEWHHWAGRFNGSRWELFLDGSSDLITAQGSTRVAIPFNGNLRVGALQNGAWDMVGNISDLRFFVGSAPSAEQLDQVRVAPERYAPDGLGQNDFYRWPLTERYRRNGAYIETTGKGPSLS